MRTQHTLLLCASLLISPILTGCNESTAAENNSKVYKAKGSIQCQPDSGTPLEVMQMELVNGGIDVVCAQTGSDGRVYAAVCGESSGVINVYEIRTVNLLDAEALGFASVMSLPEYVDQQCE